MRYFYDTEFLENGKTIKLISIGIVAEDGRELYAVSSDIQHGPLHAKICSHRWLMESVVPSLPLKPGTKAIKPNSSVGLFGHFTLDDTSNLIMPRRMIRNAVRNFLLAPGDTPELWADYGAYDHVALVQLFGTMMQLPPGMPMFTNEFQQAWRDSLCPPLPTQEEGLHNALEDARHLARCYDAIF